ncbi:MAG: RNA-binding protein [Candidatus Hecatellales archaeon]|nr:MAG: RNA-binding protein [Candidatus Hecatellales archaeon]
MKALDLPPRRVPSLTVAIPASTLSETPHLREKTVKTAMIGRALAIFRVDKVAIYRDQLQSQRGEVKLMATLLSYMATPQYLRKSLFKIIPELKFSGLLPPLRIPSHPLEAKASKLKPGSFRQGLVIGRLEEVSLVDVGVEKPARVKGKHPLGKLLNVKILRVEKGLVEAEAVETWEIPYYWGFKVEAEGVGLPELVRKGGYSLTLATSRYGEPLEAVEDEVYERWRKAESVLVAFGSPREGLKEILARHGMKPQDLFDFTVNTIKLQGTETVRVEEALTATLAVLNHIVP